MQTPFRQPNDLVIPRNFIRAVRDSGYLSTATALAELVDNALQASATTVAIAVSRASPDALPEISVTDNGVGMSRTDLEQCLRFGGTSRFDGRTSFGRFGMGLPAASLSQARRIEVASWRGHGVEDVVALDVDAIVTGVEPILTIRQGPQGTSESGCRVRWMQCDRIEYRRLAWLERSLRRDLGRMYRRFIADGLNMTINDRHVDALDPTFLTAERDADRAQLAFDDLSFEFETVGGDLSVVTARFVILPIEKWHRFDNATKRRIGIVSGGSVSILRAGREIANGWHLMGGKRRENYDDWWRCEIDFDPPLDEHFGITINKQGIRPCAALREAIEPELEARARILNARVRQAFEDAKFRSGAETSCNVAAAADRYLPVFASGSDSRPTGPLAYKVSTTHLPPDELFTTSLQSNTLEVRLNVDHPAFSALYRPLQAMTDIVGAEFRTAFELLFLSFARSAAASPGNTERLVADWGATYGRMLQEA